jgi:hypothetical protein
VPENHQACGPCPKTPEHEAKFAAFLKSHDLGDRVVSRGACAMCGAGIIWLRELAPLKLCMRCSKETLAASFLVDGAEAVGIITYPAGSPEGSGPVATIITLGGDDAEGKL